MSTVIFTIIAKNYLPFARVLMASVRSFAPDARRVVVLADETEELFDPSREDFEVVLSRDLGIPRAAWFHFKYPILELSTAIKPWAIEHVLNLSGADRVFYFDPDICLYSGLDEWAPLSDEANVLLTPHITTPLDDGHLPSDLTILRAGTYNLGFIAVRSTDESRSFLRWWQAKLYDHCIVDLAAGLFVDQKWCDLVPGLFAGVRLIRDPGCNVAYWNLPGRSIAASGSGYTVNGRPLRFFHFSGLNPLRPEPLSRHQNRLTLADLGPGRKIVLDYCRRVQEAGYETCRSWPYAYGKFKNGSPVPDVGREVLEVAPGILTSVADPFSDEGFRCLVEVWNQPAPGCGQSKPAITNLAHRIYQARTDVQLAMPDLLGADRIPFLNWFVTTGVIELGIGDEFTSPVRKELRQGGLSPTKGQSRSSVPAVAQAIFESRPDLQRAFPEPFGRDAVRFAIWLLTHGSQEYRFPDPLPAGLREYWAKILRSCPSPLARLRHRATLLATETALRYRPGKESPRAPLVLHDEATRQRTVRRQSFGANFFGYIHAEMGVGEAARCAVRAARSRNLPVSVLAVDADGPYRLEDHSIGATDGEAPHFCNIFHVNADQADAVLSRLGSDLRRDRINVGYWAWELEEFPDRWRDAFRHFDEIWVPSMFCQAAVARKSPIPVLTVPPAISVRDGATADRASLGIPEDAFLFVAVIDLLSIVERKNPLGLLRAFRAAFDGSPHYQLILKVNHGAQRPEAMRAIREAAAELPVRIIDRTIDRDQLSGILRASDCFVSLHRSEGFGLTIAEAMFLGKPVVVTGYSGNLDFTTPENAFLVDYDMTRVGDGCEPYDRDSVWAEPREDSAAAQMRLVAEDHDLRERRAARGSRYVREHLTPEAIGARMVERLELLYGNWTSPTGVVRPALPGEGRDPLRFVLIGDVGGPATMHAGDEAMLAANVSRLRSSFPGANFTIVSSDPQWSAAAYGCEAVGPIGFPSKYGGTAADRGARLGQVLDAARRLQDGSGAADCGIPAVDALARADTLLISGGGNLCSTWPEHLYERAALLEVAAILGKHAVVGGQTIGPELTPEEHGVLASALRHARIVGVRDADSVGQGLSLGVDAQRLVYQVDDAFLLEESVVPADRFAFDFERGEPWIAVTIAPFWQAVRDPASKSRLVAQLREISRRTGLRVVIVPHVEGPNANVSDVLFARDLLGDSEDGWVTALPRVGTPGEAKWLCRQATLVVSTRYHPVVFATACGVPALGFFNDAYTCAKIRGALGHAGLQDWAVPLDECLEGGLVERVLELQRQGDSIREHLRQWRDAAVLGEMQRWARVVDAVNPGTDGTFRG